MAKQKFPILTLSTKASGTVTARRAVTFAGAQVSVAGAKVLGVAVYGATDGQAMSVDTIGTTTVECGGTVSVGAELMADASGKAVAVANGGWAFCDALEAGVSGSFIEVLLRR